MYCSTSAIVEETLSFSGTTNGVAREQLKVFKIAVGVASVGLAADYRAVGADDKDALLICISSSAAGVIQISDQPLSGLIAKRVGVVDRAGNLHGAEPRRNVKSVAIFETRIPECPIRRLHLASSSEPPVLSA